MSIEEYDVLSREVSARNVERLNAAHAEVAARGYTLVQGGALAMLGEEDIERCRLAAQGEPTSGTVDVRAVPGPSETIEIVFEHEALHSECTDNR